MITYFIVLYESRLRVSPVPLAFDDSRSVAGIGAGQAAQHHHRRHESNLGIVLAAADQGIDLIQAAKVMPGPDPYVGASAC